MQQTEENIITWPDISQCPYDMIAGKITEMCKELRGRDLSVREDALSAAKVIWPTLQSALRSKGKVVGLNDFAEPVMPEWATEPIVCLGTIPVKVKNKTHAMNVAKSTGHGGWATIGELWLWVADGGPIIEKTMRHYGYLKGGEDGKIR